jgi:hypothetical protein
MNWFMSLEMARASRALAKEYNEFRPHSALKYLTPANLHLIRASKPFNHQFFSFKAVIKSMEKLSAFLCFFD